MPFMEDAFIGRLVTISGGVLDARPLPFAARSDPNSLKMRVHYPHNFCHYLFRPNVACNKLMGASWCKMNDPLVLVHPVDIINGASMLPRRNGTSVHFALTNGADGVGSALKARRRAHERRVFSAQS